MPGQSDHYYFFHAHHQLNGKELRYLRTLKVRAAVYRGFAEAYPFGTGQNSHPIRPLAG